MTSDFEAAALKKPVTAAVFCAIGFGAWVVVRRLRQGVVEIDKELIFEDIPFSGFEILDLADSSYRPD